MKPGDQVRDYILEQRIGAGGVGEVWRARHIRLNKPVALKLILPHLCDDENIYSRFVQEAITTANLEHPHIISVHDFFSLNDDAILVMSYIEGGSVQDRIKKRGRLPLAETQRIASGILDALDFAHQKGTLHRDVKPSNILLSPDLHAYLVDFGIALVLGKTRITRFGANVGTPDYMSPEQIRGEPLDHRTDVYSFGCVLYEMLAGRSPFRRSDDDTEFVMMERHINEAPTPLRNLNPEIDKETEAVVMRALEKDREKRFGGCRVMADALLTHAAPSALVPSLPFDKTSRILKAAVAALALTTLVSAGGWVAMYGKYQALRSAGPTAELDELRERLDTSVASARADIAKLRNELEDANAANEKSEKEVLRLQKLVDERGATDDAAVARLEKELQELTTARDRAEQTVRDLRQRLAEGKPSDGAAVTKLKNELADARSAHERTIRELRQVREKLAIVERELQEARKSPPIPSKATEERIARLIRAAGELRERGDYDAALSRLNAARALDPSNTEIRTEIEKTARACNAEKRLGRTDLKC